MPLFRQEAMDAILLSAAIIMSLVGSVNNIVNLTIFMKIKPRDSINISLMGLAVSDFFVCLTTLLTNIFLIPPVNLYLLNQLSFHPIEFVTFSFLFPHSLFARSTIYMTALITLERCLCVAMPLKVKLIVTPARIKAAVVAGFVLVGLVGVPIFYIHRMEWVFIPAFNKSMLRHVVTDDFYAINAWYTPIDAILFYGILFATIVIGTAILIVNLNKKMMWRKSATTTTTTSKTIMSSSSSSSTSHASDVSTRDKRIVKMVVIISSIFTVCFLPTIFLYMVTAFVPNFTYNSENGRIIVVLGHVSTSFLEPINSTMNTFVYYNNSSNYKHMFNKTFHIIRRKETAADKKLTAGGSEKTVVQ